MGARFRRRQWTPQCIVSSPALRALATAEAIAKSVGFPVEKIALEERLYDARVAELLSIVRGLEDRFNSALIVGHNPAVTELVNDLQGGSIDIMPPGSVARLRFTVDSWSWIGRGRAVETDFDWPQRAG
jgi:phosphohistidine phosphatase